MLQMSETNTIEVTAAEVPIERVIVFNDRAEVKRVLSTELAPGTNEVKITVRSMNSILTFQSNHANCFLLTITRTERIFNN